MAKKLRNKKLPTLAINDILRHTRFPEGFFVKNLNVTVKKNKVIDNIYVVWHHFLILNATL